MSAAQVRLTQNLDASPDVKFFYIARTYSGSSGMQLYFETHIDPKSDLDLGLLMQLTTWLMWSTWANL